MNRIEETPPLDSQAEEIRRAVKSHYAQVAESADPCCSPTSTACACGSYDASQLELVPIEAVVSSRGCGNPTALAELQPGEYVLDLGSGGGLDAFLAAQRVGPEGFVYGVDATPEMIDLARRNAARAGVRNVEFLPGDLEQLPLPDASVDVIISNCVVNLTPDKSRALGEAFRVLRPGGRLAISDIVIDPDLMGFPSEPTAIRAALDWAGCAAGALTRAEWQSGLAAAGFEDIHLAVAYRMSVDDIPAGVSRLPTAFGDAELRALAARFTSSLISARKPSRGN